MSFKCCFVCGSKLSFPTQNEHLGKTMNVRRCSGFWTWDPQHYSLIFLDAIGLQLVGKYEWRDVEPAFFFIDFSIVCKYAVLHQRTSEWKMLLQISQKIFRSALSSIRLFARKKSGNNRSKRPRSEDSCKIVSVFRFGIFRVCFRNHFPIVLDKDAFECGIDFASVAGAQMAHHLEAERQENHEDMWLAAVFVEHPAIPSGSFARCHPVFAAVVVAFALPRHSFLFCLTKFLQLTSRIPKKKKAHRWSEPKSTTSQAPATTPCNEEG